MLIRIRNKSIKFHVKVLRTLLDWTTIPFQRLYEVLLNTWWANIFCNLELLFLFKRKYIYLWKLWLKVSSHDVGVTPKGRAIQRAHVTRHDREGVFHWFNIKKSLKLKFAHSFLSLFYSFLSNTPMIEYAAKKPRHFNFTSISNFNATFEFYLCIFEYTHIHPRIFFHTILFVLREKSRKNMCFFFQENKAIDW